MKIFKFQVQIDNGEIRLYYPEGEYTILNFDSDLDITLRKILLSAIKDDSDVNKDLADRIKK